MKHFLDVFYFLVVRNMQDVFSAFMICGFDGILFQCRAESSSKLYSVFQRQNNSLTTFGKVSVICYQVQYGIVWEGF